ncbi:zinc finger BED domain-containing protein 4-like [Tachysurus ichikawai]
MFASLLGSRTHQEKPSAGEERWNIYDELDRYLWEAITDRRPAQPLETRKENKSRLRRLAPLVRKSLFSTTLLCS